MSNLLEVLLVLNPCWGNDFDPKTLFAKGVSFENILKENGNALNEVLSIWGQFIKEK